MPATEEITVAPERFDRPVELATLFRTDGPVEVEIGCGKGGFLLRQARANPDRNYLGIEWANGFYRFAADRMARWGLENIRIIRADARQLFLRGLPPACLAGLHTYHPDPWPKRRHAKRRLFQPDFVNAAVRALAPDARWAVQTDHEPYFEQIQTLLSGHPDLEPASFDDPTAGTVDGRMDTNFEIKYLREGRPIHRIAVTRRRA